MITASPNRSPDEYGDLIVELPHWTAAIHLFDNLHQLVPNVGPSRRSECDPNMFEIQASLPAGVYEVEVIFGERTTSEWVSVRPKRTTRLSREPWNSVGLISSTPFHGSTPFKETGAQGASLEFHSGHAKAAADYSRHTTCPDNHGDSRLFMFIRASIPLNSKSYPPSLASGLSLLTPEGKTVAEIDRHAHTEPSEGFLAFNADFPSGYYLLRVERPGIRIRHQPIYLSPGWETHIFLLTRRAPGLRTMTLTMSRLGQGFCPNDDAAVATQAILDILQTGGTAHHLTENERMQQLLEEECQNPWLGVLTAYALRRSADFPNQAEKGRLPEPTTEKLLADILKLLDQTIGDHPDVHALKLGSGASAAPFHLPPLLQAGLALIKTRAIRDESLVPMGSLTDLALARPIVDSPWTAWHRIDRLSMEDRRKKTKHHFTFQHGRQATAPAMVLSAVFSPKAPVFPLQDRTDKVSTVVTSNSPAASLDDLPMIEAAGKLMQHEDLYKLPDKVTISQDTRDLLGPVEPEQVSAATGIPLARTKASIARLKTDDPPQESKSSPGEIAFRQTGQAIVSYAIRAKGITANSPAADSLPSQSNTSDLPSPMPSLTIEECAATLRAAAAQLASDGLDDAQIIDRPRALRMQQIANALLSRADLAGITNAEGRLTYANEALQTAITTQAEVPAAQVREDIETIIGNAATGLSTVDTPQGGVLLQSPTRQVEHWEVHRTAFEDKVSNAVTGHLSIFRDKQAPKLLPGTLERLEPLLPRVTLQSAFIAFSQSSENRNTASSKLDKLLNEIELAIQEGGPARPATGSEIMNET